MLLKVKAVPGVPVIDSHGLKVNLRRWIGWERTAEKQPDQLGVLEYLKMVPDGVYIEEDPHILDALKKGELVALDDCTMKRCGVSLKESQ